MLVVNFQQDSFLYSFLKREQQRQQRQSPYKAVKGKMMDDLPLHPPTKLLILKFGIGDRQTPQQQQQLLTTSPPHYSSSSHQQQRNRPKTIFLFLFLFPQKQKIFFGMEQHVCRSMWLTEKTRNLLAETCFCHCCNCLLLWWKLPFI